jgi:hypothetical protein
MVLNFLEPGKFAKYVRITKHVRPICMNNLSSKTVNMEMMIVECSNVAKHGIPTGWYASREFKLDDKETEFWNTLSKEEQIKLWNTHFDSGVCLLCLIDEKFAERSRF